jgi:hypothetical protein
MKLKSVLDSLDGIDEALKAAYTEKDGKFYLNVEGYDPVEVETLRTTMRRVKLEKKEATDNLNAMKDRFSGVPDDMSGDDIMAAVDKGAGKVDQRLVEQKARLDKQWGDKVTALTTERDDALNGRNRLYAENALMQAMSEANITLPSAQKAVKAMFMAQVKVDKEGDDIVTTIGDMPVLDKLKSYAQSDEGKFFVSAPDNRGGGAGGGTNKGTTDYSKKSSTELAIMQDTDPLAKAEMERRTKIEKPPVR